MHEAPNDSEILKQAGDPDWNFFSELEVGVRIGVDVEMARTPQVFEERTKWNLEDVETEGVHGSGNYSSVEGHIEVVKELFRTESRDG